MFQATQLAEWEIPVGPAPVDVVTRAGQLHRWETLSFLHWPYPPEVVQPLLPLASALAEAGHDVAVATGRDLCPRAEEAGFVAFEAGLSIPFAFERLAAKERV